MLPLLYLLRTLFRCAILANMDRLKSLGEGTYIIAVSGGVDSTVLLDALARQNGARLVVAHFDHGIRPDSQDDRRFVADLAARYGLDFESERQELGVEASEETARQARYGFLRRLKKKHAARAIVTAHHADDIIETMVINLLRGTGWRGLCSLKSTAELCRPLLAVSKKDILAYARKNKLAWKEDSTNSDERYLRNAVRRRLAPSLNREAWLGLYDKQKALAAEIDREAARLRSSRRHDYIMWPPSVACEVLKQDLNLTYEQAARALQAIKTARSGHIAMPGSRKKLIFTRDAFIVAPLKA